MSICSFEIVDLGVISWSEALQVQLAYAARVPTSKCFVLLAEHPPVLTLGRNADARNLKISAAEAARRGVAIHRSERGGDITAHLPGQILLYPILRLANPFGVRAYVRALEQTALEVLRVHGLSARVRAGLPGVWVGMEKIAFVGIRIKHRVTHHGLALNVNNDLELFNAIVPCGLADVTVTSMCKLLGRKLSLAALKEDLATCWRQALATANTPVLQ